MSFRSIPHDIVAYLRQHGTPTGLTKSESLYYIGYPRSPSVEFPIVAITPGGGSGERMAMGDPGNRFSETYQIDIYTDSDAVADIGGGTRYAQNELITYLSSELSKTIRDDRCTIMDTVGLIDIWISSTPRIMPYIEDMDLYRGIMRLTIQYNDPRS